MEMPGPHLICPDGGSTVPGFGHVPRRPPPRPLARLSNSEFAMVVVRALADCRRRATLVAVLVVRVVETALPDQAGGLGTPVTTQLQNAVLDNLALRLQRLVRNTDQVVFIDSRHVGVLLVDSGAVEASLVDGRACKVLASPYSVEDQIVAVRLSLGRATFPDSGVTGQELVSAASRVTLSLVWPAPERP